MSLILDALKKSEQERQRDRAPGLQSIHQPPLRREAGPSRQGWWIAVAGLFIVVNAAALAYWLWSSRAAAPVPIIAAAPVPQPVAQAAEAEQKPAQKTLQNEPVPATVRPAAEADAEYTRITPAGAGQPQQTAGDELTPVQEVGDLPDSVRNNLPAMTFSFHVYSANPEQRTIIINNRRMRAGDEIAQGLQLQEITEDGVILAYAGYRIHIGVLTGW